MKQIIHSLNHSSYNYDCKLQLIIYIGKKKCIFFIQKTIKIKFLSKVM